MSISPLFSALLPTLSLINEKEKEISTLQGALGGLFWRDQLGTNITILSTTPSNTPRATPSTTPSITPSTALSSTTTIPLCQPLKIYAVPQTSMMPFFFRYAEPGEGVRKGGRGKSLAYEDPAGGRHLHHRLVTYLLLLIGSSPR